MVNLFETTDRSDERSEGVIFHEAGAILKLSHAPFVICIVIIAYTSVAINSTRYLACISGDFPAGGSEIPLVLMIEVRLYVSAWNSMNYYRSCFIKLPFHCCVGTWQLRTSMPFSLHAVYEYWFSKHVRRKSARSNWTAPYLNILVHNKQKLKLCRRLRLMIFLNNNKWMQFWRAFRNWSFTGGMRRIW